MAYYFYCYCWFNRTGLKYIRELDSIRGIGVITVILFHWLPIDSWYNTFPNRPFGVDVFFVLSGYLITHILLESRLAGEHADIPRKHLFLNFYWRRALRIFPVYFLVLLLVMAIHEWLGADIRGEMLPSLSFTLNFHFYTQQYWGDITTHLWTLSVEEQFYLFWPCIILLLPKRALPHVIASFIAIGVLSQLLITNQEFGYLPTNTCFDAFGIGAWIAWVRVHKPGSLGGTYAILRVLGIISVSVLIIGAILPDVLFLSPQRTLRSLVAAWATSFIIYKHYCGQLSDIRFFRNPVLLFVGKISYGMYLYHIFLPWLTYYISWPLIQLLPDMSTTFQLPVIVVQNFGLLILVSWLSYKFIERPIFRLGARAPGAATVSALSKAYPGVPLTLPK